MIKIHEPTKENPYRINKSEKIILRTACSAGVNRSAVVREILKRNISNDSIIYPQHGADYGDHDRNKIMCAKTDVPDGFNEIFGCKKSRNVQETLYEKMGHDEPEEAQLKVLANDYREEYTRLIKDHYWSIDTKFKNVFVVINNDEPVIDLVIKRLSELNVDIDLVILRLPDTIYYTDNPKIKSQSVEAYNQFIELVNPLFKFE
ncbi:hypothetical protein QKU48_gp1383 [Fadolivirus algeromassiliense]|jgi:hypothetical protein|uniref:Uncharacterized protein n=1 Tax=Fadolivirus FV1/VV64 TaxID=3070911 RepID=A0A7D3R259_9VIRU|nr:hypothetical protein QKU48_gp1383 [Fadolivirus algeromassiliense]QKF94841.1 hypothetical protein Fadolivirus_1_1383 [Fadolivirus FV1/VV64]